MELFPILNQSAATISRRLANCSGCTACCERGGVVYLHEEEVPTLEGKGVPVLRVDGVPFIKRLADGSCPMLNRERRECSIYESRPLCCRLFPLDAIQIKGEMRWAVSDICPEGRRRFEPSSVGKAPTLGIGSVARMTAPLSGYVDQQTMAFFRSKEQACSRIQRLEDPCDSWTLLAPLGTADSISVSSPIPDAPWSMELGHKEKQKLKEKLKEKKEKKKKKKKKKKK